MKHTKALRRQAELHSIGMPYARYVRGKDGRAELHPLCTKAMYKKLRREAR